MFMYDDGEILSGVNNWYYHCGECHYGMHLRYTIDDGHTGFFECKRCGELYVVHVLNWGVSGITSHWRRWRFMDETAKVPESLNEYVCKEGFLYSDDNTNMIYNHANSSTNDKFAYGKGVHSMSVEEVVFGDMDPFD